MSRFEDGRVGVLGAGMSRQDRRDMSPHQLAHEAARAALSDAGIGPSDLGLVLFSNAFGGELCDQESIRGQSWLDGLGLAGGPVVNLENACAGGISAVHLGAMAVASGERRVMVIGVEKMFFDDRDATRKALETALPCQERESQREKLGNNPANSVFMGLNAEWARRFQRDTGAEKIHFAAAASKARFHGSLNPYAQIQKDASVEEIMNSRVIAEPLTRGMCSSYTDGAAAVILDAGVPGMPYVSASVMMSGDGTMEYHDRMTQASSRMYETAGMGPKDLDMVEVHDATSAEELLAIEAIGLYEKGTSGPATLAGETRLGGSGVTVNPSGGLVSRGHPIGATGICQVTELTIQLRGSAGARQVEGARAGMAVNTGGIIGEDVGSIGIVLMRRD